MRHVGCFKLYLQNNWGLCVVFHGGVAGDLNASLCIAFCCDTWFYLLEKNLFVREIFCNTIHWHNPEQVRWCTQNIGVSISSNLCCLLPKSVGIYLEYMEQRKGCFKGRKPEGIFVPVVHICNEVRTEDLGEPWSWFIPSEVLALVSFE